MATYSCEAEKFAVENLDCDAYDAKTGRQVGRVIGFWNGSPSTLPAGLVILDDPHSSGAGAHVYAFGSTILTKLPQSGKYSQLEPGELSVPYALKANPYSCKAEELAVKHLGEIVKCLGNYDGAVVGWADPNKIDPDGYVLVDPIGRFGAIPTTSMSSGYHILAISKASSLDVLYYDDVTLQQATSPPLPPPPFYSSPEEEFAVKNLGATVEFDWTALGQNHKETGIVCGWDTNVVVVESRLGVITGSAAATAYSCTLLRPAGTVLFFSIDKLTVVSPTISNAKSITISVPFSPPGFTIVRSHSGLSDIVIDTPTFIKKKSDAYPHTCPSCASPAFLMFTSIECSKAGCKHYKAKLNP